jgi:pimeloyl-ACP methyl ester carboxylesterase
VFTPTLTGIGERAHLLSPQVDLETHIADVVNLIKWEQLTDVVLCGHSYAGCIISGVVDRVPDSIRSLVYLDAFAPEAGQSLHDTLPAEQRELQLQLCKQYGDGWKVPPIPAEVFGVNADDAAWVDRQCTMQPLATFQQPLKLQNTSKAAMKPTTYILATGFKDSPFPQFHKRAQTRGWKTLTMACGHDVMLDDPQTLVKILQEA